MLDDIKVKPGLFTVGTEIKPETMPLDKFVEMLIERAKAEYIDAWLKATFGNKEGH